MSRRREAATRFERLLEGQMTRTLGCGNIATQQRKIAELGREVPTMTWTTPARHIDAEWLEEAYRRPRKDGAVGVDGVTAKAAVGAEDEGAHRAPAKTQGGLSTLSLPAPRAGNRLD